MYFVAKISKPLKNNYDFSLRSGAFSLGFHLFLCRFSFCCIISIDSSQMFVMTVHVIHCTFLVMLHWSYYVVNSLEAEIPKANIFSSGFNNKIVELFFLKRTYFVYCIQICIELIF